MTATIHIRACCPNCHRLLLHEHRQVDGLAAIEFRAKIADQWGRLYLSQIYGSYNKVFNGIDDIAGALVTCSCPHCQTGFPDHGLCDCGAPIVAVGIESGGMVKVCTRNGCKQHSLEFENIDDAFFLFYNENAPTLC